MTGPLGETAGKGGVPELPAVAAMTVFDLQKQLAELADGRACSIHLGFCRGRWVATAEVAGSGIVDRGAETTGTGCDAETAIRAALARLPGVRQ